MNNLSKLRALLPFVLMTAACASLTKSQLDEVNQFGKSTKTFPAFPAKVLTTLNDVQVHEGYFVTAYTDDPALRQHMLDSTYDFMTRSAHIDSGINLAFQALSDYGQKLVHLTANVHQLQMDTAAQSVGTDLDNVVTNFNKIEPKHQLPTGWGALIGQVIDLGGDLYVQSKQAKYTKKVVAKGDSLISGVAASLSEHLNSDGPGSVKFHIKHEQDIIQSDYQTYLQKDQERVTFRFKKDTVTKKGKTAKEDVHKLKDTVITGELYAWRSASIGADSLYLKLKIELHTDEVLRAQCVSALQALVKAHHKLLLDLDKRKTLKETYTELQGYYKSINQVYTTYKKIK